MKLIYKKETDGSEHYISPMHVEEIKVVKSSVNKDWCIDIIHNGKISTILCKTEKELNDKLAEVKSAMESI